MEDNPTRVVLQAALSAFFCRISAGSLSPAARWLTRARLCWQRKKNGKQLPNKMEELLRSAYAKQLANPHQVFFRSKALRVHQWCISLPGACEALCHWRGTIEPMVANGPLGPLVAADLDLVNMFDNAESPRIPQALRTHFLEASAWTEWPHQSEAVTSLSTEATFATNRGAEQGVVLGTIQSALVLGDARGAHPRDFLSSSLEAKGVCDEWFVDDGQVFVRPWSFEEWLRALDAALASFGATRGCAAHCNVKSSARLLCPPERMSEFLAGTHRTFTTPLPSAAQIRAPLRWCLPSALASKSTRALGNRCAPVTKCSRRSLALITHPQSWCSPRSVLTCPSSGTTCASTVTSWTTTCLPLL